MDMHAVVGENVKRARKREGITQTLLGKGLAALVGRTWTKQTISQLEKGTRQLDSEELVQVAAALGTTVVDLLTPDATAEVDIGIGGIWWTGEQVGRIVRGGSMDAAKTSAMMTELRQVARSAEKLAADARRSSESLGVVEVPEEPSSFLAGYVDSGRELVVIEVEQSPEEALAAYFRLHRDGGERDLSRAMEQGVTEDAREEQKR